MIRKEVLEKLKKDTQETEDIGKLLEIFKKSVQLEINCFESEIEEIRLIAYNSQDLQYSIETKIKGCK